MGALTLRCLLALWTALLGLPAVAAGPVTFASADGKLQLTAQWFPADAGTARPVMLALHGCNGMLDDKGQLNGIWRRYASHFNAEQMHFLVLDSFGPRGLKSICEIPEARRTIHDEDRRDDVFSAMHWLAQQPGVDTSRIVVAGWSHGASTLLSVLDASDKAVQAQTLKPRAAVAFYPGCNKFQRMWNYEVTSPLLLMIGELDDWTPAAPCVELAGRLRQPGRKPFEMTVYPGSYHGFDSLAPVAVRDNVGNTRSGKATSGGNPQAREQSHVRMFDFLSMQLGLPMILTHEQRLRGHHYVTPPATNFAAIDDVAAVPVSSAAGRERYLHYRSLPVPKAFVVTEKGQWYLSAGDPQAIHAAFGFCARARTTCWLYAVDDQVVWQPDMAARAGAASVRRVGAGASR